MKKQSRNAIIAISFIVIALTVSIVLCKKYWKKNNQNENYCPCAEGRTQVGPVFADNQNLAGLGWLN
jgi:hypothetical protein